MRREKNFVSVTQISTVVTEEFLLLPYSIRVTFWSGPYRPAGVWHRMNTTRYDLFQETAFKMSVKGNHQIPWEKLEPSGFF